MIYLIDTNILLYANKISNPMDIHPTYWSRMSLIFDRNDVMSIDKVKREIYYQEDNLTTWCKENVKKEFWKSTNDALAEYAEVQNWAQDKNYNERALLQFADVKNADPFLVAFALDTIRNSDKKMTIVTLEVSNPDSKKIVKLPDV